MTDDVVERLARKVIGNRDSSWVTDWDRQEVRWWLDAIRSDPEALRALLGEPFGWDVFSVYESGPIYEYTISRHAKDWERRLRYAESDFERVVPLYALPEGASDG